MKPQTLRLQILNSIFYSIRSGRSPSSSMEGFTLIEVLVVVIVITVLSAIALPSMLQYANRARESEARSYVSSINKGQQAYFLQNNSFGDLPNLSLGIPVTTQHYTYTSVGDNINQLATTTALPNGAGTMRGFAGQVWVGAINGEANLLSILCEGNSGAVPTIVGNTCP
ncbi:MAG: type IV pilin-like G/H family protein [Leptolyngbyaceae bacterium]|nr:type IV pilin-like G/H family protein [Leptolyngbyaceae bacterium]